MCCNEPMAINNTSQQYLLCTVDFLDLCLSVLVIFVTMKARFVIIKPQQNS